VTHQVHVDVIDDMHVLAGIAVDGFLEIWLRSYAFEGSTTVMSPALLE